MCLNSKKQFRARSKEFLGIKNIINQKKDHLEKLPVTMTINDKYGPSKTEDWR